MNYIDLVKSHALTMPEKAPPIMVAHPKYGKLGDVSAKGFAPAGGKWSVANAIARDACTAEVTLLKFFEAMADSSIVSVVKRMIRQNPLLIQPLLTAISTYDGIVAARGSAATGQDVWMQMTATLGGVTLSWYDSWTIAWTPGSVPSVTAYTNAGTGGAVMTAASNGSWVTNPGGTNKKYIVAAGLSTPNITGFTLGMMVDVLWAGSYVLTTNATINPTTDVAVTRWTGTDSPGNMMQVTLTTTLTHTVAATVTTSYINQAGGTGQTTISICPATGPLIHRILFNTLHNSATVVASSPFMPLTNGGNSGVRNLEQVVVSGGTMTAGTVNHQIVRPLLIMPFIAANSYIEQDNTLQIGGMKELVNASQVCGCLKWDVFTAGTTATTMSAFLRMVEG